MVQRQVQIKKTGRTQAEVDEEQALDLRTPSGTQLPY